MIRIKTLSFLAALLLPLVAQASGKPLEISKVVSQQEEIRADVMKGEGRYANIPEAKRDQLLSKQAMLLRMLDGKETAAELTEEQQLSAFNTLEWIEATINQEYDDRLVCVREKKVGTNRISRTCRTAAQWEEARERAREELDRQSIQTRT